MNRKAMLLGGIIGLVVVSMVILLILLVFSLGSSVIKKIEGVKELVIYTPKDVGINDVYPYLTKDYRKVIQIRAKVSLGEGVKTAIEEVKSG